MRSANKNRNRDGLAAWLIGFNAVADAVAALAIAIVIDRGADTLGVVVGLPVGLIIANVLWTTAISPTLITNRPMWRSLVRHSSSRDGLMLAVSRFDWPLLAVAILLAGPLSAGSILGLHPMLFALILGWLTSGGDTPIQYRQIGSREISFMLLAVGGVVMAISSQGGSWMPKGALATATGCVAAFGAALLGAFASGRFTVAHRIVSDLQTGQPPILKNDGDTRSHLASAILVTGIAGIPATLILLFVALIAGSFSTISGLISVAAGIVIGGVFNATGNYLRTKANLTTTNLTINSISCFQPLLAICLFIAAGLTVEVSLPLALGGGAIIALANIALGVAPVNNKTSFR